MEYIEIKCYYSSSYPGDEVLPALLGKLGFDSFMETDEGLSAYIPAKFFSESDLNELLSTLPEKIEYEKVIIPDQNWNAVWESNFEPVQINDRCRVRAPFHEKLENVEFDLIIEPRMAFGTAHHETTFLMLKLLLEENVEGKTVLDMGCGTGVIAILAEKMGAASVVAIDNDEWAYNNTIDNLKTNHTKKTTTVLGDASVLNGQHFDVIFANINRNILLQDMEAYCKSLKNNGSIFFSGFYVTDNEAIKTEAEKHHILLETILEKKQLVSIEIHEKSHLNKSSKKYKPMKDKKTQNIFVAKQQKKSLQEDKKQKQFDNLIKKCVKLQNDIEKKEHKLYEMLEYHEQTLNPFKKEVCQLQAQALKQLYAYGKSKKKMSAKQEEGLNYFLYNTLCDIMEIPEIMKDPEVLAILKQ